MIDPSHIEAKCQECGGKNIGWYADNWLWNLVMRGKEGIICPDCFSKHADELGITIWFKAIDIDKKI